MTGVPQRRGRVHQGREMVAGRKPERVAGFEATAADHVVQEAAEPTVHSCPLVALLRFSFCFSFFVSPDSGCRLWAQWSYDHITSGRAWGARPTRYQLICPI